MRKLLCLVVASVALSGCGVNLSGLFHDNGPSNPAKIVVGGQGLNITPGACIGPDSTISKYDSLSTTVTVVSKGLATNTYALSDTLGNKSTGSAGKTVGFDQAHINLVSPPPPLGTVQRFTFIAAH